MRNRPANSHRRGAETQRTARRQLRRWRTTLRLCASACHLLPLAFHFTTKGIRLHDQCGRGLLTRWPCVKVRSRIALSYCVATLKFLRVRVDRTTDRYSISQLKRPKRCELFFCPSDAESGLHNCSRGACRSAVMEPTSKRSMGVLRLRSA